MAEKKIISNAYILIATFLPHFAVSLTLGSVGPLAPFFQADLNINRAQIGFLTSVHSMGWIVMAMVAGSLVERTGIRLWLFLSPVFSGVCALIFSSITSYNQGVAIFLILGIAFSFINPATTKAIIIGFSQVGRGTAMAVKQTGTPAGVFLASASLPVIAVCAGWKWSMSFVALINIVVGVLVWFLYKEKDSGQSRSEICYNKERGNLKKDFVKLFHNINFLLISILQGIFNIGQFVIQSYLVLYLVESLGFSTIYAGFVMAITQLSGILGRILWGLMSDFIFAGKRVPTLQVAGLTTVIGLFSLAMVSSMTPEWMIWVIASMIGAGSIGFAGTAILLRAELTEKDLAATSTGIGMAISAWGVIIGPPLFGFVVDTTHSYRIAWELIAIISLVATILLGYIREYKTPN